MIDDLFFLLVFVVVVANIFHDGRNFDKCISGFDRFMCDRSGRLPWRRCGSEIDVHGGGRFRSGGAEKLRMGLLLDGFVGGNFVDCEKIENER